MQGIDAAERRGLRHAGPVGECAVAAAIALQPADRRLDVEFVDGGGILIPVGEHAEVQLRESGGDRLLDAAVGVIHQVVHPALEVDGGDG